MESIKVDTGLVAFCGLYCGSCRSYKKGKCPGCSDNVKATWCKTRTCCMEHEYRSCADCSAVEDFRSCKKLNNVISKLFALVFRSDRLGSIDRIKAVGYDDYAREMAGRGSMTVKR